MYTSHGHQIPNTSVDGNPPMPDRCGGVGCSLCSYEAEKVSGKRIMVAPLMIDNVFGHGDIKTHANQIVDHSRQLNVIYLRLRQLLYLEGETNETVSELFERYVSLNNG